MAPWVKTSVKVEESGEKTIRYESFRNTCIIESRKRAIPHGAGSGKSGCWLHTSYFLIQPDGTEKEYWTLAAAKKAAEESGRLERD